MAALEPKDDHCRSTILEYASSRLDPAGRHRRFSFGSCSVALAVAVGAAAAIVLLPTPLFGSAANNVVVNYLLIAAGIGEVLALLGLFERDRQHVALLGALLCLAEAVLLPALVAA